MKLTTGDVGKEMFIVTIGQVQVVGGPDDSIVFVTLGEGKRNLECRTHFFEISFVFYLYE